MYSQIDTSTVLKAVNYFTINGRILNLYTVSGRTPSAAFSLYWDGKNNPLQHNMTAFEVFNVLSGLLEPPVHKASHEIDYGPFCADCELQANRR